MSKHTPGPWTVQRIDIDCGIIQWAIELPDMRVIAHTGADVSVAQDKANARLIAAAPEMLQALKEIVFEFECQYDTANEPEGVMEKARLKVIKQCKKAIAKAEGKK